MPAPFIKEFSKLQDAVTPSSIDYVKELIQSELGKDINEVFSLFDETPLAAASIGQVHRATIRSTGQEVVVKV